MGLSASHSWSRMFSEAFSTPAAELRRTAWPVGALLGAVITLTGCSNHLESFLFNGLHCSEVDEETCSHDNRWNRICARCDEPYPWDRDYEWFDTTLDDEVPSVRPIRPGSVERHDVPTADGLGTLDLYRIPSHGENPATADITIVYNHGNYGNIEHYLPRLRFLHEAGYEVWAWDYRGYGKSQPNAFPTGPQFLADARTIWDWVAERAIDPDRMISHAHSLGGIPAIEMALHGEPLALFLEAPFTSTGQLVGTSSGVGVPGEYVTEGYYENVEKIADYDGPLLLMHGEEDRTFSVEDQRELFDAASGPGEFWLLPDVAHGISSGGVPEAGLGPYFDRMESFVAEHAD